MHLSVACNRPVEVSLRLTLKLVPLKMMKLMMDMDMEER